MKKKWYLRQSYIAKIFFKKDPQLLEMAACMKTYFEDGGSNKKKKISWHCSSQYQCNANIFLLNKINVSSGS
ncbi:hypothetical protein DERP_004313 [Dermatophagoides pteronyssinus]|uniref:Uncharacterized protein n=1 Tax=Dermatophagoides pteronyssinus TaxID=6956 RepID=A0ABQ8JND8_DERPT|nr:hypothetical protein DERP_004313 [Dermatophagoides pteronyssinus]